MNPVKEIVEEIEFLRKWNGKMWVQTMLEAWEAKKLKATNTFKFHKNWAMRYEHAYETLGEILEFIEEEGFN